MRLYVTLSIAISSFCFLGFFFFWGGDSFKFVCYNFKGMGQFLVEGISVQSGTLGRSLQQSESQSLHEPIKRMRPNDFSSFMKSYVT